VYPAAVEVDGDDLVTLGVIARNEADGDPACDPAVGQLLDMHSRDRLIGHPASIAHSAAETAIARDEPDRLVELLLRRWWGRRDLGHRQLTRVGQLPLGKHGALPLAVPDRGPEPGRWTRTRTLRLVRVLECLDVQQPRSTAVEPGTQLSVPDDHSADRGKVIG
jgi:hypothetical protein